MKISSFKVDEGLEITGVWRDIGDKARLLIARDNNPKFVNALRDRLSPYQTSLQKLSLDDDKAAEMLNEILADTILLGWENIEDDKDDPIMEWKEGDERVFIPYSRANAILLLTKYKEFKALVIKLSGEVEAYRSMRLSETLSNVKK